MISRIRFKRWYAASQLRMLKAAYHLYTEPLDREMILEMCDFWVLMMWPDQFPGCHAKYHGIPCEVLP